MTSKKQQKEKSADTLTDSVKVKIVRPSDQSWEEIGPRLHAIQMPIHRVLNQLVVELEMEYREGKISFDAAKKARNEGKISAQTRAYQLACDLWNKERQKSQEAVDKGNGSGLDSLIAETGVHSNVINGCKDAAFSKWKRWRKKLAWQGLATLPTFRRRHPIYIASSGGAVSLSRESGVAKLNLALFGRGMEHSRVSFNVIAQGNSDWSKIHRILNGIDKLGDCKLVYDEEEKVWTAILSRTFSPPKVANGGRTMAVHRGMWSFVTCAVGGEGGKESQTRTLATGDDIIEQKRRFATRRRQVSMHGKIATGGTGAKGHGVARRFERITKLESVEENWVKTRCQQVAAAVVKFAASRGVSRILLDDWANPCSDKKKIREDLSDVVANLVRSFPFAQLKNSIAWAAQKNGIVVEEVEGAYESRDCPACGHRHEEVPLRRDKSGRPTVWFCGNAQCGLERNVDQIAAWNMLVRAGSPSPHKDAKKGIKRAVGRLKAARPKETSPMS